MAICKFLQYNVFMHRQPRLRADRLKQDVDNLPTKLGKLAEDLGISYETLYKTLRGEIAQPPAETIAKIALRTGRSIEYYMDLTDSKTPLDLELTDLQQDIVELLSTLPPSRQRDILLMTKTFADADNSEEQTRQFFIEVKELLKSAADAVGRSEELDHYMELVNEAERRRRSLPPPINNDGDAATNKE